MMIKEFRELARDRRTLALLIAIPILLLIVFGYAANFSINTSRILVVGEAATEVSAEITTLSDSLVMEVDTSYSTLSETDAKELLRDSRYVALVAATSADTATPLASRTHLWIDGSQLFAAQEVSRTWIETVTSDNKTRLTQLQTEITQAQEVLTSLAQHNMTQGQNAAQLGVLQPTQIQLPTLPDQSALDLTALSIDQLSTTIFNPDLSTSWIMIPGLIGLILTFVGTVVTSIGLVREREAGTLEQLAAMPLSPAAIIGGKVAPYLLLALVDAGIITGAGVWIFGVPFEGNIFLFIGLMMLFVTVVLGVGILISSVSENTGQAIQLAIMTMVPQILLSGLIFPLEAMATGVRWIGYCLPLTWFTKASQGIMLRGAQSDDIWMSLVILGAMAIIVFGIAIARMARSLTHGGSR
ncbi:ABC transporter permease [Schaalia suimastitidis]|uniref:ABC transporter permease n=1 Tax=Schaalia suimastitidis TaxID=121163 RepID=UPI00055320AF|nr:ABC transporter permease [Schaalia suimastitidis]